MREERSCENFFYDGDDLGIRYEKERTEVTVWAPVADRVEILVFRKENDTAPLAIEKLEKGKDGAWKTMLDGDWSGFYYIFRINYPDRVEESVDPYARAVGTDSKRGLIVDLKSTDPPGWNKDRRVKLEKFTDAIIYEVHVRDFSASPNSGIENKGKYLAFTEEGTTNGHGLKTGIDHLKSLGITHVHLLPVADFATVDDEGQHYNWGYDPYFYNVPEGSYSINPSNKSRLTEFKKLIMALHEKGIGVIMDMVYNHTFHREDSPFQKFAPDYFYRFVNGYFADGSGCGNELATEKPMVRKFIVDSVCYWAKEYHIDGFRFDLMGLMDEQTMIMVEKKLHAIDKSIIIYGEPWFSSEPQLEWYLRMGKGSQQGRRIAVFNDDFRESVKGIIFGSDEEKTNVKEAVVGGVQYDWQISNFTEKAGESINYVSCHDNLTLWDKICSDFPYLSKESRVRMHRLAHVVVFTSQGIPFIQGGDEFLRTKHFHGNSYCAGDHCNQLKWERKARYQDTFDYFRGLITLRKDHPAFRMTDPEMIRRHLSFIEAPGNAVGFKLIEGANGDNWKEILVLYNFDNRWNTFRLEEKKKLSIVVNENKAGVKDIHRFEADNVRVSPFTGMVLRRR